MIPREWLEGEVAVLGLGKSGLAAAKVLAREGAAVYASDAGDSDSIREAAMQVRFAGGAVDTSAHDLERIARATVVVASPGIAPSAPALKAARDSGVPVVSEIEVALHALPATRLIAVTGTNGKTTTTALVGHLLRGLGLDAVDAGNIGTPLCEVALADKHPAWTALELSSFQLHDTPSIAPAVGVITNLSPDHLDRYANVQDYYADKAFILRNDNAASRWVINADQDILTVLEGSRRPSFSSNKSLQLAGITYRFSLQDSSADAYYDRDPDVLVVLGEPLLARGDLALFGNHNVANALAASLAVVVADPGHASAVSRRAMAEALRSFRALKHRLEPVGEFGGVMWINDSKATNVSSTLVAVEGMTRPTVLLLGGRHKGEPYTALAEPFRKMGKRVIAYGEAASIVEQDLRGLVPLERLGSSFDEVMARARELAEPGDVVLLSPACSSYDMFKNYEERGAAFRRLAAKG
ncbi:MAG: UDP-N-acetylmuramoyl-L-alanine--D-glutamate ligase [Gemmatimonadaceae bacterium]